MNLRREVVAAFAAMIVILLLTSFGAVGLFARMSPAIERIIQENGYSLEAGERMLASLALTHTVSDTTEFYAALSDARRNVTEAGEEPRLEEIALYAPAAFSGDPTAKTATVEAIRGLSAINRDAMNNVDREAKRLGSAGAWSAVFLGLLGFTVGLVVVERLLHKVVHPLAELKSVLSSAMSGDRTRRCTPGSASSDVEYVKLSINTLLDQGTRSDTPAGREVSHCRAARTVLLHLLDEVEGPRLVVDQRGSIISANAAALERLRGEEGKDIKERLIEVAREDENKSSWVIARFPEADCVLCGIDA
jgi:hypothetical protein